MSIGSRISGARKAVGIKQSELAEILNVDERTVSAWENDEYEPSIDELIMLSDILHCSTDYILKGESIKSSVKRHKNNPYYEKRSKKQIGRLPLVHICFDKKRWAKGVIAIGNRAKGVIAIGGVAMGAVAVGGVSIGALALGGLAVGLLALGALGIGIIAIAAMSIGVLSIGAVAIGKFAVGAVAMAQYLAVGDVARGMFALGKSEAIGSIYQVKGMLTKDTFDGMFYLMSTDIPSGYWFIVEFMRLFMVH